MIGELHLLFGQQYSSIPIKWRIQDPRKKKDFTREIYQTT